MTKGYTSRCSARRAFLGGIAKTSMAVLAGCGSRAADDKGTNSTAGDSPTRESTQEDEILQEEIEGLESIYEQLSKFPITDSGGFVFDVNQFEKEFDHESTLSEIEDIQDQVSSVSRSDIPGSKVDAIISIAETARLLVQQRVILHQVIAAGLSFEHRFYATNFGTANEAISDGRLFLGDLDAKGESIDETVTSRSEAIPLVDGYDPDAITRTQEVLVDIVRWTDAAYKGLYHTSRGMELFKEGNSALESEAYKPAEASYRESHDQYERAQKAFDNALEVGSSLPYIAPVVDDIRCVLPAYLSSSDRLSESMRLLQSGEQSRGREIAREATNSADQIASRCF